MSNKSRSHVRAEHWATGLRAVEVPVSPTYVVAAIMWLM